jgi:anion-transporting  ArsA/GET3 family ATPase
VSKKITFITGKGGVGKSTLSCIVAREWSQGGARCRIIEQSLDHSISRYFGVPDSLDQHQAVSANLDIINVSPLGCYQSFLKHEVNLGSTFMSIMQGKGMYSFVRMLPGVYELLLLGRIVFEAKEVDHLLFDAYSSGHFLKLLATPHSLVEAGLGGRIQEMVEKITEYLRIHADIYVVTLLEDYAFDETLEMLAGIEQLNLSPLSHVLLNRVYYGTTDPEYQKTEAYEQQFSLLKKYKDTLGSKVPLGLCRLATPEPQSIEMIL